jgi:hypothetical protein
LKCPLSNYPERGHFWFSADQTARNPSSAILIGAILISILSECFLVSLMILGCFYPLFLLEFSNIKVATFKPLPCFVLNAMF